jgi:hypothetical protein
MRSPRREIVMVASGRLALPGTERLTARFGRKAGVADEGAGRRSAGEPGSIVCCNAQTDPVHDGRLLTG